MLIIGQPFARVYHDTERLCMLITGHLFE